MPNDNCPLHSNNTLFNLTILSCDRLDSNTGYVFPRHEVEKAVQHYQKKIENNTAYGRVLNTSSPNQLTHKITRMYVNTKGNVIVNVKFLDNEIGKNVYRHISLFELVPEMLGVVKEKIVTDITIIGTTWKCSNLIYYNVNAPQYINENEHKSLKQQDFFND